MANPYAVPLCEVIFEPSYEIIDKLGYHSTVTMDSVFADALSDIEAQKDKNRKVGSAYIETATAEAALLPAELAPADQQVQLLWLEKSVNAALLRPIPFLDSRCTLVDTVTWQLGSQYDTPTDPKGKGQQYTSQAGEHPAGSDQPSQIQNQWYPLTGDEYVSVWYEARTPASRHKELPHPSWTRTRIANNVPFFQKNKYEHFLGSEFKLEQNASFAFSFAPYCRLPGMKDDDEKDIPSYLRVYWGKRFALQYDGQSLKFSFDAWQQGAAAKEFINVTGINLSPSENSVTPGAVTVVVQIVGRAVTIHNLEDLMPGNAKQEKRGWAYEFKDDKTLKDGFITVEEDYMYVGVKAMPASWAYIPIYYTPSGTLTSRVNETAASLSGLTTKADTVKNGGNITITPTVTVGTTSTKFSFEAFFEVDPTVINRSPQLLAVHLDSRPTSRSIPIKTVDLSGRVRQVTLTHGIFDQQGSVVVDNRDGLLKDMVGVFPIEIKAGWYRSNGTQTKFTRFKGFVTQITIDKKSAPYSTATLNLVGRSLQLKDAIAINLPIYDGEVHTNAVQSLLERGGWYQPVNFTPNGTPAFVDPSYRLSVPVKGEQPLYMFSLGSPIWTCIEEIARPTGYWAYVDSKGVFNYVPPFTGNIKATYNEVPQGQFQYDEWLSLTVAKDTSDIKSAVMVIGLDASFETPNYLISMIKAAGGVGFGDPTVGSTKNFVPWLRWIIVQDGKINDQGIVDWVARRLFDNNNRPRWTMNGQVWGHPEIFPLDTIRINLKTDQIGVPFKQSGDWRVLSVNETINAEDKTWFMNLECEWVDPRYSYASWWGRN